MTGRQSQYNKGFDKARGLRRSISGTGAYASGLIRASRAIEAAIEYLLAEPGRVAAHKGPTPLI